MGGLIFIDKSELSNYSVGDFDENNIFSYLQTFYGGEYNSIRLADYFGNITNFEKSKNQGYISFNITYNKPKNNEYNFVDQFGHKIIDGSEFMIKITGFKGQPVIPPRAIAIIILSTISAVGLLVLLMIKTKKYIIAT